MVADRIAAGFARYRSLGETGADAARAETLRLPPRAGTRVVASLASDERATALTLRLLAYGRVGPLGQSGNIRTIQAPFRLMQVEAVVKDPSEGAAKEVFAYEAGRLVRMEAIMAPVAPRADGSSAMLVVPGDPWFDAGILDGYGLEHALRARRLANRPHDSFADITYAARVDRQMVQSFDHVWNNSDRHGWNGIHDASAGAFHLIDNAAIFGPFTTLEPLDLTGVGARLVGATKVRMPLLPEAVERWRNLDRRAITSAFERMQQQQAQHGVAVTPRSRLDDSFARIDALVADHAFVAQPFIPVRRV